MCFPFFFRTEIDTLEGQVTELAITVDELQNEDKIRSLTDIISELEGEVKVLISEREQIQAIQNATQSLDPRFFEFDHNNKRYRLNIDVMFEPHQDDINTIGTESLVSLLEAGRILYNSVYTIINNYENAYLTLLIEGNTQILCADDSRPNSCNAVTNPDGGYRLSYRRALALINYWKANGIDFYDFGKRCEVIIAGSGYFGLLRDENEDLNRRFTLQLMPKWTLDNLSLHSE